MHNFLHLLCTMILYCQGWYYSNDKFLQNKNRNNIQWETWVTNSAIGITLKKWKDEVMHLVGPQDCFVCWKVNAAVAACSEELLVLGLPPLHSLLQHSLHLHSTPPPHHLPVRPVVTMQHFVYMYALMIWFICYNCSTSFNAYREFFRMQLYRPIIQLQPTLQLKHQNILI